MLPLESGLLGPADLLTAVEKAEEDSVTLEVAGRLMALDNPPAISAQGVAVLNAPIDSSPWRANRVRRPTELEDAIVIGDSASEPIPLVVSRMMIDRQRVEGRSIAAVR